MGTDHCNQIQVIYEGNGVQLGYTFTFPYVTQTDVHVARWDLEKEDWVDLPRTDWNLLSATVIQFNTAPDYKFKIYRDTNVTVPANFHPGHPR